MKKIKLVSNFEPRSYQESIFANSLNKNALVVLPTGLGKTVIALMLTTYYFNQSNKKILFLAPTKPLVEQQKKSFENFIENSDDFNFQVLTGLVSPKKRALLYKEQDFIFSTPQLIENDIINRIIDPSDFGLVIFDEAHRGTGNYAYSFIALEFDKAHCNILALTASPGTNLKQIREVMGSLCINHIEVKRYEDPDVKPYVNKTNIKYIEVELDKDLIVIKDLLQKVYTKKILELKELDLDIRKPIVSKRDLLDLQIALRSKISSGDADDNVWSAISIAAGLMKLSYGQELFESQEISAAYVYFHNFFRSGGDSSKAAEALTYDLDFRDAYDRIRKLKEAGILHPKLEKLKEIVALQVHKTKDLKIIVFNQYRESAQTIVKELFKIEDINPVLFVGQAKKGDFKLSQKEQKKVIEDFREGTHNILVSTSVGEEGLDIPKVDLVIFYEPVPSAIRTIQRIGRTGRFNEGNAFILQSQGTRDMIIKHVANAKEKSMYNALDKLVHEFQGNSSELGKKEKGLGEFIGKESNEKPKDSSISLSAQEKNLQDSLSSQSLVYVDQRENTDLIKELYSIEELRVESKQLDVGDIIISEQIAIERKAKIDFVNSIIDKRLFPQLMDLARNFRRPILILEGDENIFTLRNINPNVIRATLSAIAVDLRIPIIVTKNIEETAQMVRTIAKRTKRDKKEISLAHDKKSHSENEEMEKFVSSIPKINVVNAKGLLAHFKSLKALINATQKDLLEVQGIGPGRAKFLREFFDREYDFSSEGKN